MKIRKPKKCTKIYNSFKDKTISLLQIRIRLVKISLLILLTISSTNNPPKTLIFSHQLEKAMVKVLLLINNSNSNNSTPWLLWCTSNPNYSAFLNKEILTILATITDVIITSKVTEKLTIITKKVTIVARAEVKLITTIKIAAWIKARAKRDKTEVNSVKKRAKMQAITTINPAKRLSIKIRIPRRAIWRMETRRPSLKNP